MKNNDEETVFVDLIKQPLESERKETYIKKQRIVTFVLSVVMLIVGLFGGYGLSSLINRNYLSSSSNPDYEEIVAYLNKYWVFKDNHPNLEKEIRNKSLYGIYFEEDPYTTYMSNDEYDEFASDINMDYVGIGVRYTALGGVARVLEVFEGSSAEEAGVKAGDVIVKVGDVLVNETIADDLKKYITGIEGTYVDIVVYRDGKEVSLNVKRKAYNTTVTGYQEGDCLVLTLSSFGLTTSKEIEDIIKKYPNANKIIIDLRDDGGGYQVSVQKIAGLFIGSNNVYMTEKYADGSSSIEKTPYISKKYEFEKMVILCNENSASCSEVLIGCLKDYFPDAVLVGTNTYGKGVVQTPVTLSSGSTLKMTTAFWYTPSGKNIHGEGFVPDVYIERHKIIDSGIIVFSKENKYEQDSVNEYVRLCELALDYLGYDVDRTDGYFSSKLKDAIINFEKDHHLKEEGIIDYSTYYAIMAEVTLVNTTDKTKDIQLKKALEIISE